MASAEDDSFKGKELLLHDSDNKEKPNPTGQLCPVSDFFKRNKNFFVY